MGGEGAFGPAGGPDEQGQGPVGGHRRRGQRAGLVDPLGGIDEVGAGRAAQANRQAGRLHVQVEEQDAPAGGPRPGQGQSDLGATRRTRRAGDHHRRGGARRLGRACRRAQQADGSHHRPGRRVVGQHLVGTPGHQPLAAGPVPAGEDAHDPQPAPPPGGDAGRGHPGRLRPGHDHVEAMGLLLDLLGAVGPQHQPHLGGLAGEGHQAALPVARRQDGGYPRGHRDTLTRSISPSWRALTRVAARASSTATRRSMRSLPAMPPGAGPAVIT